MLFRLTALLVALGLVACQSGATGKKGGGTDRKKAGVDDADDEEDESEDAVADADYCKKVKDKGHGNLAEYLYTAAEACSLKPWAFKYEASKSVYDETREPLPNSEELRSYIENFLNRAVKIPEASPGRKFKVTIVVDEETNASADGRQNIVINSGFLGKDAKAERILGVLCHEMAHSLRNDFGSIEKFYDDNKLDDLENNPEAVKVYDKMDAYFVKTYDDKTKTYTHDKKAFDELWALWKKYRQKFWNHSLKIESTADVVGGGICAALGVSQKEFRGVFEDLKANNEQGKSSLDLRDGDQFEVEAEDVQLFVFFDDTHPAGDDRIAQVDRLAGFYKSHRGSNTKLLDEWKKKFDQLVKKSGVALMLADQPTRPKDTVRVLNKATGQWEVFKRGKSHGRPRPHKP
jgi:hypothetical protein